MRWTRRIRHSQAPRAGAALLAAESRPPASDGLEPAATAASDSGVDTPARPGAGQEHQAVTVPHLSDVPIGCRVVVVGPAHSLRSLSAVLPPSWTVEHVDEVGDMTVADLVVVAAPTPGKVAAVLARQPDASVLALVHPTARVDDVVELLHSGATACVRATEAELVAAHLVACARRYSVGAR